MYFWDIENTEAYNNRMGHYKTKYEFSFINRYVTNSLRILDVGGGSGRFAIPLHELGNDVVLIDKSNEAADLLVKRSGGIKVIIEDLDDVVFAEGERFDLILIMEMLVYIGDWPKAFRKLYNVLRDNGTIIFTATNKHSWRSRLSQLLNDRKDYTILSLAEYCRIVKESKFVVDRIEGFLWIPCKVASNSMLVSIFAFLERILKLNNMLSQSPWLLFAIKKDLAAGHVDESTN